MLFVLKQNVLCKYNSDMNVNMSSAIKPDAKYVAIQYLALSLGLLRLESVVGFTLASSAKT